MVVVSRNVVGEEGVGMVSSEVQYTRPNWHLSSSNIYTVRSSYQCICGTWAYFSDWRERNKVNLPCLLSAQLIGKSKDESRNERASRVHEKKNNSTRRKERKTATHLGNNDLRHATLPRRHRCDLHHNTPPHQPASPILHNYYLHHPLHIFLTLHSKSSSCSLTH